ncbi:alpha-glucosidase [Paenibacillus sp. KQZ6P-2]|uniref:Alpha-glucosidase n=1 Tax=Paenibacillus mangrovi TaxID=2931978 RepID=A0A9X1WQM1_9BACL|nr:alpha-glucosidase [Paenibacillus mangrovi]MCJ8012160.1 alpha-glucosidase [Paenibacillus mangrovi]
MEEREMQDGLRLWRNTVFYEIYMPSFCDGNGDGTGDFRGLTSKLDYLQELGIGGIWLTPFYPSPRVDNGYDISDYYGVDPDYGTLDDFDQFVREAHQRGIKIIADLVLNHTSSEHPWFIESRSSRTSPKRDWYIWKDAVSGNKPNNWESFFGGTAWEWDEKTGQYYYHAFAKEQVDLNWAHPEVRQAMKDVMAFWLNRGIDGFRLDVINFLKVSGTFPDNPSSDSGEQEHLYDQNQEGILETIRELCDFVRSQNKDAFMVGEVGSEDMEILRKFSGGGLLDVVFNFNLGSRKKIDAEILFQEIENMEKLHGNDQLPTLFFGSHDMPRHISRFSTGEEEADVRRAKLIATFMLTVKGVPFIYYGDEIGIRDFIPEDIREMRDIQGLTAYQIAKESGLSDTEAFEAAILKSRDHSRTPMQWDASTYAGFSERESWIPLSASFRNVHVENQRGQNGSLFEFYRSLIKLRRDHSALHAGDYTMMRQDGEWIGYTLQSETEKVFVSINFGSNPASPILPETESGKYRLLLTSAEEARENDRNPSVVYPLEAAIWVCE